MSQSQLFRFRDLPDLRDWDGKLINNYSSFICRNWGKGEKRRVTCAGWGSGKCPQIRTLISRPSNPPDQHSDIRLTLFTLKLVWVCSLWGAILGFISTKWPGSRNACVQTFSTMLPLMVITCISSCPCHHVQCPVLQDLIWISQANFHPNINNKLHPAPSHGDTCSVFLNPDIPSATQLCHCHFWFQCNSVH